MLKCKQIIALLIFLFILKLPFLLHAQEGFNLEDLITGNPVGTEGEVLVIQVIEGQEASAADSILNHLGEPEDKNEIIDFLRNMFVRTTNLGCERAIPFIFNEEYRDAEGNLYFGVALKDLSGYLYMPNATRVGYFRLRRTTPNPITAYYPNIGSQNQYFLFPEYASCYHLYAFSVMCDLSNAQSEGSIIIVEKAILKEESVGD